MLFLRIWRWCRGVRYGLGRWLIRPEATRIIKHYRHYADNDNNETPESQRCAYICIGAQYVANGWPHRPWQEAFPSALNDTGTDAPL